MGSYQKGLVGAVALLAAAFFIPAAQATTITTLYNTGVDGSGVIANGSADSHYTIVSPTGLTAVAGTASGGFPIGPWLGDNTASRWIGPENAARFAGANGAVFHYVTTFSLAGLDPTTAAISGQWSTDDQGLDILINGNSLGLATVNNAYNIWTAFSVTSGFVSGLNTLEFVVLNSKADCCGYPAGFNPTGLRVEFTSATALATPLPATWTMMFAGLAVFGFAAYRRKKQTAKFAAA